MILDAFFEIEAYNKEIIKFNTWGHLAPKAGQKYKTYILFAVTEWGRVFPIKSKQECQDSSWFYNDMCDFLYLESLEKDAGVYHFLGSYKKFKNGNYRFCGKVNKFLGEDLNGEKKL
jgi:hypothetical protein